jgi:hypothetical protein
MPIMVAPSGRLGASLGDPAGGGAAGGVNVGGAMPIIVPLRFARGGLEVAGGAAAPAGGGGSGGWISSVPPRGAETAEVRGAPQELQTACWSEFCVPHWPHCFIARGL